MKNQGIDQTIDSLNDDFLESVINSNFSFDSEDMDAVDKVLAYRQICMPLTYKVNNKHAWEAACKNGFKSRAECLDGEAISFDTVTIQYTPNDSVSSTFLVTLTRMDKVPLEIRGKINTYIDMSLQEIYERYIKGTDIVGICIFGPKHPYVVTTERIEKLLKVDEPKEC